MKKIFYRIILALLMFALNGNIFSAFAEGSSASSGASDTQKQVYVTAKVPGANCTCVERQKDGTITNAEEQVCQNTEVAKRLYVCSHGTGIQGFQDIFKKMVRWVVNFSILLGVLAIAALGVVWAASGSDDPAQKKFLKNWIINLIIGLVILFMFRYILGFIAPWIFQ